MFDKSKYVYVVNRFIFWNWDGGENLHGGTSRQTRID